MNGLLTAARIRVSGELAGYLIVLAFAVVVTYFITWLLGLIPKYLLTNNEGGKKAITVIQVILWIAALVLVILDFTDVAPIIRNVIFAILGE